MSRIILHIDMDAFFASIEERENPALRGKPIVIGADPKGGHGRGVVSTASYAARKFGIHSAIPISTAWTLCPAPMCAYLPVDMNLYGIVSARIMKIVREVVEDVPMEQVSVDEAYVEIKNAECKIKNCWDETEKIAKILKHEIFQQERLTSSVGIGPNKLIAKIASDFKKPDGLTVVRPEEVADFLAPMAVRRLAGIGPKMERQLSAQGVKTIADLRLSLPKNDALFARTWGIDDSPVVPESETKSLGHEITFDQDTRDQAILTKTMLSLCDAVLDEVRKADLQFRTITIRVRFDNFETRTSSYTLPAHTHNGTIMSKEVLKLLFPYFKNKRLIRLIGVRVSNFRKEVNI